MSTSSDPKRDTVPLRRHRLQRSALRLFIVALVLIMVALAWPRILARTNLLRNTANGSGLDNDTIASAGASLTGTPTGEPVLTTTSTPTATETETPVPTLVPSETPNMPPVGSPDPTDGVWILALQEGVDTHLFAFHPDYQPLTCLTAGAWHDLSPTVSPDGTQVVFVSNRTGQWDLYSLNLMDGTIIRLSDTPAYEGSPSWSPDGLWLAYEYYDEHNLEIYVSPVAGDQSPIPLTTDPGGDYSPSWSPQGRQIAFVSTREGGEHIWLADLDQAGDTGLRNLSAGLGTISRHPSWSPDGRYLAWSSTQDGIRSLFIWDSDQPYQAPRYVGSGDWPAWSPDGLTLLSSLETPSQDYLTAYNLASQGIVAVGALAVPGSIEGLTWYPHPLPDPLPDLFLASWQMTPSPIWLLGLTPDPEIPAGRRGLVPIKRM